MWSLIVRFLEVCLRVSVCVCVCMCVWVCTSVCVFVHVPACFGVWMFTAKYEFCSLFLEKDLGMVQDFALQMFP